MILVAKLAGITGGGLGFIFMLYSMFFPLKMTAFFLPMPIWKGWFFKLLYHIFFFVLYGVALPLGEILYYVVFLREIVPDKNKTMQALMISGFYALTNWFAIIFMFKDFFAQLWITILAFGAIFGLLYIVINRNSVPLGVTIRFALSFAVMFWLLYLDMSRKNWLPRSTPNYYYNGNVKNIWRRGGSYSASHKLGGVPKMFN